MARIVMFDANPDSANLVRRLLERSGHAVWVIAEPELMTEVVRASVPAVVILRVRAGNRKSEQLPQKIRRLTHPPKIMTISSKAPSSPEDLADEHYLMEPVDLDTIERKVHQLLGACNRTDNVPPSTKQ
ncbi:MAG: hypothetical protein AB1646_12710 [Thermodesulfobacteriota bacterium]